MTHDIKMTSIESIDELNEFWTWVSQRREGVIALDTETEGLNWWSDKIRLVQIGDANHGWSMRWDRWSGIVEQLLNEYDGKIAMHNFKFDTEFLRAAGVYPHVNNIDDTRTMAHLIDPDRPTGLKPLSDQLIGRGMSDSQGQLGQMMKSHKWDWKSIPFDVPIYWQYAALDTVLTARLYDQLDKEMDPYRDLYDMEMAAQIAIMDMEIRGARVDTEYCAAKAGELRGWTTDVRRWAEDTYSERLSEIKGAPARFNIGSGAHVAEIMMSDGWEPKVLTATGKPKMAKEVLELVEHPLAKTTLQLKHAEKMASAYFDNFLELEDGGFLHAKINPLAARTGRMGVTSPALQTLPRDALVRDAIIPREGNKLILIDYDQMEVRIGAHFFGDQQMIDDINNFDDIHTEVASRIYGVAPEEVQKPQRQVTKNAVYAILYNAGIATFAKTAGIPEREAKEFMTSYNAMYPGIRQFKRELEKQSYENRTEDGRIYVKTPYGRIQPVDEDLSYKLINYLIQGTGADVLKHKIAELSAAGLDEFMVLPVHDEMMFDVPEEDAEDVKREAEAIMTAKNFAVPLTVEGVIVDRWGDKYRKEA